MPHLMNQPASPGEGPLGSPTPALPDGSPAQPGEGPAGLPTPSLPSRPTIPVRPPAVPAPPVCPLGYQLGMVLDGQSYGDILIQNNVSYNAMRAVNPSLSVTRPAVGSYYCAPPSGSRRLCPAGSRSYVMLEGENLSGVALRFGVSAGRLLQANPNLAPGDFTGGRVICIPQ